ncbi:hypothetical protein QWZ14_02860 [Paeniroseomonas aquatica]|uniref:Uncharacterized protein n=2 Tax=Paeniroseomonas aquatica TaxID=373043 RepID=A0ABT8A0R6_9PROT|nr:hypothetical protein [Paeniroseomonas aquatica]MDN3563315.1 hypothetical protein [Paeniroseomonas aquatica]
MSDPSVGGPDVPEQGSKMALWQEFCDAHHIARDSVPLFATSPDGAVEITRIGRSATPLLRRSEPMDARIGGVVADILRAQPKDLEGLLYLMLRLDGNGDVVPLYIGRAGRHSKNGTVVSANLKSISQTATGGWTNSGKFARWGYGYAYHMGDLSCAVLAGHEPRRPTPKYMRWARQLFVETPASAPRTRFEVRFWCIPWGPASPSIWQDFGACPLAFIEYLLIGVANLLFPDDLLNEEGVNRRSSEIAQSSL